MATATNRTSARARDFYDLAFNPRYQAFLESVKQTPLVLVLWGPRQRTGIWNGKRQQIRDLLTQWGHSVLFHDQLGTPTDPAAKKGVDFLQSQGADVVIGIQSTYDSVGTVEQFADFRVIDSKLMLFIDDVAPDRVAYETVLESMQAGYNNVATWKAPLDVVQENLAKAILAKIGVMQLVKYCAMAYPQAWSISIPAYAKYPPAWNGTLQPFPYNLLELYRHHRAEIDTLNDSVALFILAYVNFVGSISAKVLARQLGLEPAKLEPRVQRLVQGEMMMLKQNVLALTDAGKHMLEQAGLAITSVPERPKAKPRSRRMQIAGLSILLAALIGGMVLYWSNVGQVTAPMEITPDRPAPTATRTYTPTPFLTPTPLR